MISTTLAPDQLASCNKEPIHIPGAIQSHGALLVLDPIHLHCIQVSENLAKITGIPITQILNQPIQALFAEDSGSLNPPSSINELIQSLKSSDPFLNSPLRIQLQGKMFDCLIHTHDGQLILELECAEQSALPTQHHRQLQRALTLLREAQDLPSLYQTIAKFVAQFTGYERVMVYKFDVDWHGEVVGEHLLHDDVDSYFGHHFPAGDIPTQARELYSRSWLRIIPNSSYQPVPLHPVINPLTKRPTDLSFSVLRSVSPVHLEYLRNMEVAASMSISLIINGQLWGLIACHHRQPRPLAFSIRSSCEILGQVASLEISSRQETQRLSQSSEATRIQTKFFDVIAREQNFVEALIKYTPDLLQFMQASGAAIYVNEKLTLLGQTPSTSETLDLIDWLQNQSLSPLLATEHLSQLYPPAMDYAATASGLLALRLSRVEPHYILWFRPEVITTVTWAGNPEKPTDPALILHPRKSFAAWKQTVTGHSQPWISAEMQGARELLSAINALVLRRTERLIRLNEELERKNTDLNSFAYIAAHDLKEPLRGIAHYSNFIREDYASILPEEALQKLKTIHQLSHHCTELLEALNHFSKLGRMDLSLKEVSLNDLLDLALALLEVTIRLHNVQIIRPPTLPTLLCDPVLIREVLYNLIHNAIHYNLKDQKLVEIGFVPASEEQSLPQSFYIRDNGIGIREKHHHVIFDIFRRLHPQGEYGTGTGAGLAITKSIIERHGGRIWVESTLGEGTTFHFTLGDNINKSTTQ